MKFNLKNRPKLFDPKFASKADDWFEGFEKELREMVTTEKKLPIYGKHLAKEILGE